LTKRVTNRFIGIVVGEYLYIDGGEIYYLDSQNSPQSVPLNSTYSISLASSWTNASVSLNQIPKGSAPVLNSADVWADKSGTAFYSYNGIVSQAYTSPPQPPSAQLWQFVPDGNSGSWTIVDAPNLKRLTYAGCTSGNGSAYILGGWSSWRTDIEYYDDVSLRHSGGGLVTYSMDTRTWSNQSIAELTPSGWSYLAEFHYLQGLQRDGLLLAMGGATAPAGDISNGEQTLNSYGYVSLFDTATGQWYNQSTTGDIPAQRYYTCSVGVQGDNGTYEVRRHRRRSAGRILIITRYFCMEAQSYQLGQPTQRINNLTLTWPTCGSCPYHLFAGMQHRSTLTILGSNTVVI
jgi:hypothetical protein